MTTLARLAPLSPPFAPPGGPPDVPTAYAKRLYFCQSEARLGVTFAKVSPRDDGAPGDAQYRDHASGGWDNVHDVARHVRPMYRPFPDRPNFQCFAIPADCADSEDVIAMTCLLKADGTIGQEGAPIDSMELAAQRGFMYLR